ncbi:MAG: DUF6580 family putative transport protein [Salibacteraceae bacterium]
MSRTTASAKTIALVGFVFIALIVLARVMPHLPNFTPVAAAGLFLAFAFGRKVGIAVVGLGMVVTDLFFAGGYQMGLMISVYIGLMLPVVFGPFLHRLYHSNADIATWKRGIMRTLQIGGLATAGAVIFFLVSNFGVWFFSSIYPATVEGLVSCYVMALPFFKNSLMGDLFYSGAFFGIYYLLQFVSDDSSDRRWEDRLRKIPVRKDK